MGFLSEILSRKTGENSRDHSPENVLDIIRQLARENPGKALRQLRKAGIRRYEDFGFNAIAWESYAGLHAELTAVTPEEISCVILRWSMWDQPTVGDLIEAAREIKEELVYLCGDPGKRYAPSAADDAAALHLMASEGICPMVLLGDDDLLVRRQFLIRIEPVIDPRTEDVIQELIDAATQVGLKTYHL